jgi:hypothetical protein
MTVGQVPAISLDDRLQHRGQGRHPISRIRPITESLNLLEGLISGALTVTRVNQRGYILLREHDYGY